MKEVLMKILTIIVMIIVMIIMMIMKMNFMLIYNLILFRIPEDIQDDSNVWFIHIHNLKIKTQAIGLENIIIVNSKYIKIANLKLSKFVEDKIDFHFYILYSNTI